MSTIAQFGLLGLGAGAVYALLGLGLVLEHRTTTVVNFAHGAMAMAVAYVYVELRSTGQLVLPVFGIPDRVTFADGGLGMVPSLLVACTYAAILGLVVYSLVFRPLRRAPVLARVVASVGLMGTLQGAAVIKFGTAGRSTPALFPNDAVAWFGVRVPVDRYWLVATAVAMSSALWATYRFTRWGVATRAAAQNERGAAALGYSPTKLAALTWVISTVLGGLAGILIVPVTTLNPAVYTLFVVPALAACLVARFRSFAVVVAAGITIGVSQAVVGYLQTQHDWIPTGSQSALPFVVIVVVMVLVGRALPDRLAASEARLPQAGRPRHVTRSAMVGTVAATAALYTFDGVWRGAVIQSLVMIILCLSMVVITGYVGQISLVQMGFAGVGGFAVSGFADSRGFPFPVAFLLAGVVAAAVGVVLGIPALRVRGVQLAVVTFALAVTLDQFVFGSELVTSAYGSEVPTLTLFGLNLDIRSGGSYPRPVFGLVVLAVLLVLATGVANLGRSALGRRMLAVRANELAAAALGIDVARTKITAFAIGAFIAGCGGALIGYQQHVLSGDSFSVFVSLQILAVAYIGGISRISGAVVAGVLMAPGALGSTFLDRTLGIGDYQLLLSGIGLIGIAIFHPDGLSATMGKQLARLQRRLGRVQPVAGTSATAWRPDQQRAGRAVLEPDGVAALEVTGTTVQYGGVRAVDDVSFSVRPHTMVGLIGPNGAGKTTFVDAITGFVRPTAGQVRLDGVPLDRMGVHERARYGLSRTFQAPQLFDGTVLENLLAADGVVGGAADLVGLVRHRHEAVPPTVAWAAQSVGIAGLLDRRPSELPMGQRKLVEVARALVSEPRMLVLDEPAAGLDVAESQLLGERLRALVDLGITILLVEHDMRLVLGYCDEILVLDHGALIATGDPRTVRTNPAVVAAYLGDGHLTDSADSTAVTAVSP